MNTCENCKINFKPGPGSKGRFCSVKCTNIAHQIYTKDQGSKLRAENVNQYLRSPNHCLHCKQLLSYDKRSNKFCDSSCAASYNNQLRSPIRGDKPIEVKPKKNGQFKIDPEIRKQRAKNAVMVRNRLRDEASKERIRAGDWITLSNRERRLRILHEQNFKCSECGIEQSWNNKKLKFDLDHINGDRFNNSRENLRFLCPNCHSQTDTYKTKNHRGKLGKPVYTDIDIIKVLEKSESLYKALVELKLNPHGGNYIRLRRIIKRHNLQLPYILI